MNIRHAFFCHVILAVGFCFFADSAHAQATRTWVSGVGDDANPCSRTAPCKTFAGAISKTAARGVISVLDPGGFGAVTITKSITIDGGGIIGSILAAGTTGVIVNAAVGDSIRLRNLSIDGAKTGISGVRFLAGGALILDNVRIHDFSSGHGVHFVPTGSARLIVNDSAITNNLGPGISVQPDVAGFARVSLDNVKLNNNFSGLQAQQRSVVSIRNSFISHNNNYGVLAMSVSQPTEITIDSSQITNNGLENVSAAGVRSQGPLASVVISENLISGNPRGIHAAGGGDVFSFGSNRVISNTVDGTPTGVLTAR